MTLPPGVPEDPELQQLLTEIRRTLGDNKLFLKKLRDDDTGLDSGEETPSDASNQEEDFEEL